ncbi:MAG: hypothetical protein PHS14_00450 [Elusimicrobia bacterium]|nr:hypothetical protein [Elusimicrobiota bacterium]
MNPALVKTAVDGLRDYYLQLKERGGRSTATRAAKNELARHRAGRGTTQKGRGDFTLDVGQCTAAARRGVDAWERRKMNSWRSGGRLTRDGVLRASPRPAQPWTLERVAKACPESNEWDHLAALIILNGVIDRGTMKNIIEVVEKIADERFERQLQDPSKGDALRKMIREELEAVFGEVLGTLRRGSAPPVADTPPRQNKCSRCGVPGHRAKTCQARGPVSPDKWACVHCSNLTGKPLADPITHPIPPKEFHKDDPSYRDEELPA